MPLIALATLINAPVERVFNLARSLDLHIDSMTDTGERIVGGLSSGLIGPGDTVTWSARHLGVRQRLTSRITLFDPPRHFRDSMVKGAFQRFDHDHFFEEGENGTTVMRDRFDFTSPLGPAGRLADTLFLMRYMTRLLEERNRVVKAVAESEQWKKYLLADTLQA